MPAVNSHFWHFLRLAFAFLFGGLLLSMLALQLSPAHQEAVRELALYRKEVRLLRSRFDRKTELLEESDKKKQLLEKQLFRAGSDTEKVREEIKTANDSAMKLKAEVKETAQELERIKLERDQAIKKTDSLKMDIEETNKKLARLTLQKAQEKKECDLKVLDLATCTDDTKKWKLSYQETKNKLELMALQHAQVKKDEQKLEGNVKDLEKKVQDQASANTKVKQKLVQAVDTLKRTAQRDAQPATAASAHFEEDPTLAFATDKTKGDQGSSTRAATDKPVSPDNAAIKELVQDTEALVKDQPAVASPVAAVPKPSWNGDMSGVLPIGVFTDNRDP